MNGQAPGHDQFPVCMICGEPLEGVERFVRCAVCETPYHEDCWTFNGQCALFGCVSDRAVPVIDAHVLEETLVLEAGSDRPRSTYQVSGGMSGTDVAHLLVVMLPLAWLPLAVEGGWLLALNLLFIAFPLLMYSFQVRSVTLEAGGVRLDYLLWHRRLPWSELTSLGIDPLCGYALRLRDGSMVAVPAQPGELDELEWEIARRLREQAE